MNKRMNKPMNRRQLAARLMALGLMVGAGSIALVGRAEIPSDDPMTSAALPLAAAPATGAAPSPPAGGPDSGFRPGMGMGPGRWMGGRLNPAAWSPMEWEETAAFLKEHSPKRLEVLNSLDENGRKIRLRTAFINTYRNIQRLKKDDPDLVGAVIKRVELEDAVFAISGQIREAKRKGEGTRQGNLRADLSQKLNELVDTNIKERQLRIARLERTLKQERERLEGDQKSRDQLVEKRLNNLIDGRLGDEEHGQAPESPTRVEFGAVQP